MHNNLSKIATEINNLLSILHVLINEFHIESRTKSETLKHYFNLKKKVNSRFNSWTVFFSYFLFYTKTNYSLYLKKQHFLEGIIFLST